MTPSQCREARERLRWDLQFLATRSGIDSNTIWRFEVGHRALSHGETGVIEQVLRVALVEFLNPP